MAEGSVLIVSPSGEGNPFAEGPFDSIEDVRTADVRGVNRC